MEQSSVVIITGQDDFARDVVSRWQMERSVPSFTVVHGAIENGGLHAYGDLAIISPSVYPLDQLLHGLEMRQMNIICLLEPSVSLSRRHAEFPHTMFLRADEGVLETLVLLGGEVLGRVQLAQRAKRAEAALQAVSNQATLGRCMLEMRHNFNNCLTAVLGNAELLLMETQEDSSEDREQLDTIHSMALRMHQMMQRFSALESEMLFAERQSHLDTKVSKHAYVSGT